MPATPAWPPKSTPRLFVEGELSVGQLRVIDGNAAHYLGTVMRKGVGDPVLLFDDLTGEWLAVVSESGKRRVTLLVERQLRPREAAPDLWLCASPLKKPHFDMVVEKATELGVARIVPVVMRRSVADKVNPARLRAIMIEAAEQCGRTALPELSETITINALLRNWENGRQLYFADEEGGVPLLSALRPSPGAIMVGPEGGFTSEERAEIRAFALTVPITLGPRILRAETAAIAALSVWLAGAESIGLPPFSSSR
jgi:16S rRNA (uracil1498-N3)-methyltransferase